MATDATDANDAVTVATIAYGAGTNFFITPVVDFTAATAATITASNCYY